MSDNKPHHEDSNNHEQSSYMNHYMMKGKSGLGEIDGQGGLMKFGHQANVSLDKEEKRNRRKSYEFQVAEAFQYYDIDESGYQEKPEIRQMLKNSAEIMGLSGISDEVLDVIYSSFDQNSDGKISYKEFREGRDSQADRLIIEAFKHYDFDNSGYLDRTELEKMFNKASMSVNNRKVSSGTMRQIIDMFDRNKDGKISIDEFSLILQGKKCCKNLQPDSGRHHSTKKANANKNGPGKYPDRNKKLSTTPEKMQANMDPDSKEVTPSPTNINMGVRNSKTPIKIEIGQTTHYNNKSVEVIEANEMSHKSSPKKSNENYQNSNEEDDESGFLCCCKKKKSNKVGVEIKDIEKDKGKKGRGAQKVPSDYCKTEEGNGSLNKENDKSAMFSVNDPNDVNNDGLRVENIL